MADQLIDASQAGDALAQQLLAWFDRQARELPWRVPHDQGPPDPYRVWLSEVMLQQTRVETVVPYFHRFTERFPDVAALARADIDEILALWSGLGYYRRARQLHAAAQCVVELGEFPGTAQGLQHLPGIGPYTAAAVASIAFGEAVPVLDGNVERVLSRRLALSHEIKSSAARKELLTAAQELLDSVRPGDSNQALMEIGATICLPRRPRCLLCPLAEGCRGRGEPERYPVKKPRRATQVVVRLAARVDSGGRVLLFRRPDDSDVLAGTWEVPWVDLAVADPAAEPTASVLGEAARQLAQKYGGCWQLVRSQGRVRHAITFRALTVWRYQARLASTEGIANAGVPAPGNPESGWFDAQERTALPLSSLVRKLLKPAI